MQMIDNGIVIGNVEAMKPMKYDLQCECSQVRESPPFARGMEP
jgi:hypothetical protein